jgi:hypothetical protein
MSFINVSNQLRESGIKNCDFFLKLYDQKLQGVDPYNPYLPDDLKIRIISECFINPWYYLREVCRIPIIENNIGKQFELNRANLASIWCFLNNLDHYLMTSRELYKTQSILSIINWAFNFGLIESNFLLFDRTQEDEQFLVNKLILQQKLLPKYLQFITPKATEYSRIINNSNFNELFVKHCPKSIQKSGLLGRGLTQQIQFFNDVEYIPFIKTIIEFSNPAFHYSKQEAKNRNSIGCRILTSIIGDMKTESAKYIFDTIVTDACKWTEEIYDWEIEYTKSYINANSLNNMIYIEYKYYELGKDEKWFNEMCKLLNNDQRVIDRELLLKRG